MMKTTAKILVIALILSVGIFVLSSCSRTAATVNGEKITYSELDKELETLYGKVVLEALVMKKLIEQDSKKNKITASKEEVDEKINELKQNPYFEQMLKMQNTSLDALRDEIKLQIMAKKLMVKDVTEDQLKAFFEENKDKIQKIKASHILVKDKSEAEEALKRLNNGESFVVVAKEMSVDPGSKDKGGELGYFTKADMVPEFYKAAASTPAGQISVITKTPYGYHIIKVEDKKLTYDELKDDVKQSYGDGTKLRQYIGDLKKNAKIKMYLGKENEKKEDKKKDNGDKKEDKK
ncbi:MAG: peptidylprolyl isomerase [Armatimonadota bacterium]